MGDLTVVSVVLPTRELSLVFSHVCQHELVGVCDDEAVTKHNDRADVTVSRPVELRGVRLAVIIIRMIFISSIAPFKQHHCSWCCTL